MLVIPVEKKGRFSESYVLRFLCYDPATRMCFVSDKESKLCSWKHRIRLYALEVRYLSDKEKYSIRDPRFDVSRLFYFSIHGVSHHRLRDGDVAADVNRESLPPNVPLGSFQVAKGKAKPDFGEYVGGTYISSEQKFYESDDAAFFSDSRLSFDLRCLSYGSFHDVVLMMRDTLVRDGLMAPVHGGIPRGVDPRFDLHFAILPLHLLRTFGAAVGSVMYSCAHTNMIGCSPQGQVGVCMRHCYVCVTDRHVLFLSETGEAARAVPLDDIALFEMRLAHGDANQRSFGAFISAGKAPDVLVECAPMFRRGDDPEALVRVYPTADPDAQLSEVASALVAIKHRTPTAAPCLVRYIDGGDGDGDGCDSPAAFIASFADRHGRPFQWVPGSGYVGVPPSVQNSSALARSLGVVPTPRRPLSRNQLFLPYYFSPLCDAEWRRPMLECAGRPPAASEAGPTPVQAASQLYEDDVFVASAPVKKRSKLIDMMKPIPKG